MNSQVQPSSLSEPFVSVVNDGDRVAILLSTYNGERFLGEQLESLIRQTHKNWIIYASDDGSTDATRTILRRYQKKLGRDRLIILQGPQQGFAKNFMSLVNNRSIEADYFAFCDQDDIWFDSKLEVSLAHLKGSDQGTPALFCSRTRLIDVGGQVIGFSPLFDRRPTFRNALVQSLAGANTMLLNRAARDLMMQTGGDAHVVSHDWLAYLLVTGCGGAVIYDAIPTIDYRQHDDNLVGANSSLTDRLDRLRRMYQGTFRDWTEYNLMVVRGFKEQLTHESRAVFEQFERARQEWLPRRLYLLNKAGVYRQTALGNAGLMLAASIGKI